MMMGHSMDDLQDRVVDVGDDSSSLNMPSSPAPAPRKKLSKKKRRKVPPRFEVPIQTTGEVLTVDDLRDMMLWVLTSTSAKCMTPSPRWVVVHNHYEINRFVIVHVPGLSRDMFGIENKTQFIPQPLDKFDIKELPFFKTHFTHAWPMKAPGTKEQLHSLVVRFSNVPLTSMERKNANRLLKAKEKEISRHGSNLSFEDLLMTQEQLEEHNYPIHPLNPSMKTKAYSRIKIGMSLKPEFREAIVDDDDSSDNDEKKQTASSGLYSPSNNELNDEPLIVLLSPDLPEGWVDSQPSFNGSRQVYAIDCEMCETSKGSVLTRVTVLRGRTVIYDELVKPAEFITDYRTPYSGITEEMLRDVTTTLQDVQRYLLQTIHAEDIIIGHSLNNDLEALKFRHPNVIDTSIVFQDGRGSGFKPSLKWLSKGLLNRLIQQGINGHDSSEDALAAYDLAKAKVERGEVFGAVKSHDVNLVQKLAEEKLTTAIVEYGVPRWDAGRANSVMSCTDDDEITRNAIKAIPKHNFTWLRLSELGWAKGWTADSGEQDPDYNPPEEVLSKAYIQLNARLSAIYKALPSNTAMVVMSGSGDVRKMLKLREKKKKFNEEYRTKKWDEIEGFDTNDEFQLGLAVEEARASVALLTVKADDSDSEESRSGGGEYEGESDGEGLSRDTKRHRSPVM